MSMGRVGLWSAVLLTACAVESRAEETVAARFTARDTLKDLKDPSADAEACLKEFAWKPGEFAVTCEESANGEGFDLLVRFASPLPSGDDLNDTVSMEWYRPKDTEGRVRKAPAIVVVHESGSAMPAGRAIARGLSDRGLHAILVHLPYYGNRRGDRKRPEVAKLAETLRQGIADVRRARDAVSVLPDVDTRHIGLQGTSLGGFVASTAGSLDGGFDSVFVMLAGADLFEIIRDGKQDVEKVRARLAEAGIGEKRLKELLHIVEPLRVAHRLKPASTWTYSALQDDVVPIRNARKLARAANLDATHQVELLAGHYTAVLYLPAMLERMVKDVQSLAPKE